ncbi:MAG: biliverdin-producing heme oxygenase [Comamonadaceae bacterium]|nr:biliverdin-producing heme oxygenase [Comamonadaceae bacterium]
MQASLFGQQLTLMEELKASTSTAHARLQTAPFFQALAGCQLPLESYVGQLRAILAIHVVVEQASAHCVDDRVRSVWSADMRKLPLLRKDLQYFEPRTVADLKEAVDVALQATNALRQQSIEAPLAILGWLYVLEGSTLCASVLQPLVARAFLLRGDDGMAYLRNDGAAARYRWAEYSQRMNTLALETGERAQITQAANELFARLEALFRALYPFQQESKAYLAASINPEAGRHPVPDDARELQASVRAGDICWHRFPYFAARYGERGLGFARSDAAWQATLYPYPPAQVLQQVQWLGRVLSARGMPTLLLQVQLEILVEELASAIPERRAGYEKLLPAAAALHAARSRFLTDAQTQELAAAFDLAVGPEWRARFPHTGTLLSAAVADECGGCEKAVDSLRTWMADPRHFPAAWIDAVELTLAQARQQAAPKAKA